MKKITFLFAVAVCFSKLNSQPYYGEVLHNQFQTTELTTGTQVALPANAGFIIGGNVPLSASGVPNFIINKLSRDGTLTGGNNAFARNYFFLGGASCGVGSPQANNCAGIAIKEFNGVSGMAYAVAGAFNDGVFFASLDNAGNVLNKCFYLFPAISSQASKPILVVANGQFNIIGSFVSSSLAARQLYILKVSQIGSFVQSATYNMAAVCQFPGQCPCGAYGFDVTPNDAIFSPFPSSYPYNGEIIVVGEAKKYGNWGGGCTPLNESSGFFLRLGNSNLAALSSNLYDYNGGINGFTSIAPAVTTPGAENYIVGGYSDLNMGFGQSWMINLDHAASNVIWSSLVSSTFGTPSSMVSGVAYRYSASYGDTYYGVLSKGTGAVVAKLDGFGSPFACTLCGTDNNNEFNYLINSLAPINSTKMSFDSNLGAANEGIHVYGTGGTTRYFLGLATFNGVSNFSGCTSSSHLNSLTTMAGPTNVQFRAFNPTPPGMLVNCSNFNITSSAFAPASATPCQHNNGSLPTSGTNNKPSEVTSLNKYLTEAGSTFNFLPNPTSGKLSVEFSGNNTEVDITLYDCMGKKVMDVFHSDNSLNQTQNIEVDLSGLAEGIYFAKVNANNKVTSHKIVYTKD